VGGEKRSNVAGLLSSLPIAAAIDATPAYKTLLRDQLLQSWDMICLDGYGSGWALPMCEAHIRRNTQRRPVLIHISHNHEERLWHSMARDAQVSFLRRMVLWQNYRKVRALERRVVRRVDLVTTISDEDNQSLGSQALRAMILTPGFQGQKRAERKILSTTPRRAILVGSFRWVMKQENLRRFVQIADPIFAREGIMLDVVGDVPDELLKELQPGCRATQFHGFVQDIDALMGQARISVVPEVIGGGFKLKFLDYVFARVPVATLAQASAGLPQELRRRMLERDTLADLIQAIVTTIDQTDRLNEMQEGAFVAASALFDWKDRGQKLLAAASQLTGNGGGTTQSAQSRTPVAKLVESATPV
jgi:glycosyltransferase involved in cell wall biosynthesis